MNPILILSDLMQAASFASAVVLLVLQFRAFRRHHHVSFALLSASTLAAMLYFVIWQIMAQLAYKALPTPVWLYPCAAAFLLFQIVFGTWGTISLFKSYRQLSQRVGGGENAVHAPQAEGAHATAIPPVLQTSGLGTPPNKSKPILFERLRDVCRLWLLRPSRDLPSMATEPSIAILALLTLSLWIFLDRLRAGPNSTFMSWNVPVLVFYCALVLSVAYLAARSSRPRISLKIALYLFAVLVPVLIATVWLVERFEGRYRLIVLLLPLYGFTYVALNLRRAAGIGQTRAVLLLIVGVGLYFAASELTFWSASVWMVPPAAGEDYDLSHRKSESLLFDQRSKIDAVVQRFDASPDTKPRVFFVGFAGVASQRVFAEEIKYGAKIVSSRFNVKDRQLLLLNDRRDLTTFPIGTVTSLSYGLKLIGQKMDPDRDILFLALSSHGSADPEISVSNGTLGLQQLTGENLSVALQASGIKRRIIVISACHAGAFIPALRNPDTIIITAAAADKTSFGCSDDRDLTYFGEAFYRDALPKAQSLQDAFDQAKKAIVIREAQEHQKVSDPQAYFGSELQRVLDDSPLAPSNARENSAR